MLPVKGKMVNPGKSQQGFVLVIVAIGAVAILGMVGMALDFAHAATNRARLQNSLDAAALGAARVLKYTSSQTQAADAGRVIFRENILASENSDLLSGGANENDLTFEFSNTVKPFIPDAFATNFVRIRMNADISYQTWFMSVVGKNNLTLNSSSVAGVSPVLGSTCNLAPFVVCADPTREDLGYPIGSTTTVKVGDNNSPIGYGNFQLVRLNPDDNGGADVRENLAGTATNCLGSGDSIETEPGNTQGPTWQGFNTRFGITGTAGLSSEDYPPDKVVTQPLTYEEYKARYEAEDWDFPDGMENRRIMSVPIADCSGTNNGQTTLATYPTPLCIFLTQQAGTASNAGDISVEVIDGCVIQGIPGPAPSFGPGPTTIQLYGDADRWDT